MRIAFITSMASSPWGGSEHLWAAAAADAAEQGHDLAIFAPRWPQQPEPLARLADRGATLFLRRRAIRGPLEAALPRVVVPLTYRQLPAWRPEVVCISQGSAYDSIWGGLWYAAERLCRGRRVPYVVVSQANSDRTLASLGDRHRRRGRNFFGQAARAAFLSDLEVQAVERQLAQRLPNAVVLRNPVNLRDTSLVPWPDAAPLSMAVVARLHAGDKGQDILFETLADPKWNQRDWRLTLYGEGPSRGYLAELVAHFGLADRVYLAGWADDVRAVWERHHLLVLPSRSEGVPLALVEAMLCGRPAVATDVGGVRRWIDDGRTGFLAAAPTPFSLGEALERAWQSRNNWEPIGRAARAFALQHVDPHPGGTLLRLLKEAA